MIINSISKSYISICIYSHKLLAVMMIDVRPSYPVVVSTTLNIHIILFPDKCILISNYIGALNISAYLNGSFQIYFTPQTKKKKKNHLFKFYVKFIKKV